MFPFWNSRGSADQGKGQNGFRELEPSQATQDFKIIFRVGLAKEYFYFVIPAAGIGVHRERIGAVSLSETSCSMR